MGAYHALAASASSTNKFKKFLVEGLGEAPSFKKGSPRILIFLTAHWYHSFLRCFSVVYSAVNSCILLNGSTIFPVWTSTGEGVKKRKVIAINHAPERARGLL